MVPGQEANVDLLHNNCMLSVLIRIAQRGNSNEYTQQTISR